MQACSLHNLPTTHQCDEIEWEWLPGEQLASATTLAATLDYTLSLTDSFSQPTIYASFWSIKIPKL